MIIKLDNKTGLELEALAKKARIPVAEVILMAIQLQANLHSKYTPEEILEILKAKD